MRFFELIFRLGIMIAVFGFIWGIIRLILGLLRGGSVQSIIEEYFLKSAKYIFLVNVVVLNDIVTGTNELMVNELVMTGLILFMYFVSNMQRNQEKYQFSKNFPPNFNPFNTKYSFTGELIAIGLGISAFVFFTLSPQFASYGLSQWFYDGVISIENTFIIGFVFKVIGFFFLVRMVQKIINSIFVLLTGAPVINMRSNFNVRNEKEDQKDDDDFDDFEEIK